MKTLLIEPFGGVAGDMMTASLLGLGIDLEAFEQALKTLPTTESWSLILTTVERHSIIARHFLVSLDGEHYHDANGESHSHSSEHTPHHHHHRKLDDVLDIINGASGLSSAVKRRASAVFTKLAEAEAEVHGKNDPKGVHFHEVGAVDAIIDITGVCLALELLGVEKILSTPVPLGTGSVKSAHGTLPVPVPATVNILCGIPVERTNIPFELATPTGAAILATLVDEWISAPGEVQEPVSAKLAAAVMLNTSYGAGTRDIPHRAGVLRSTLFKNTSSDSHRPETDTVSLLECEMDDMPGEAMTWLSKKLLESSALDYSLTAVTMKKNRPGVSLRVICRPESSAKLADLILRETTTLGVRRSIVERFKLRREIREVETPLGTVSAKFAFDSDGAFVKAKPEYESVANLAEKHGCPFLEVLKIAERSLKKPGETDATDNGNVGI